MPSEASINVHESTAGALPVKLKARVHARVQRLRVAVLYAGRMYGSQGFLEHAANHLETLIRPNDADVFLVTSPSTWCDAPLAARLAYGAGQPAKAEGELLQQARHLFGSWPRLHVALSTEYDPEVPHEFGALSFRAQRLANVSAPSSTVTRMLHMWFEQFAHYARVELLRRVYGPHDVLVRVRLDGLIGRPVLFRPGAGGRVDVQLESVAATAAAPSAAPAAAAAVAHVAGMRVLALGVGQVNNFFSCVHEPGEETYDQKGHRVTAACPAKGDPSLGWKWQDWLFIGTEAGLAPLATMTERLLVRYDGALRCAGLCQEEQTVLHLRAGGVQLSPIHLPFRLAKVERRPPRCAIPLLNVSELERRFAIPARYVPCPPRDSSVVEKCDAAGR